MPLHAGFRARLGAAAAVVALLVLVACGSGDDDATSPASSATSTPTTVATSASVTTPARTVLSVTVRGGSVVEGASRQRATLNEAVTIRVTSDAVDEVHVHGYDKKFTVAAGQSGEITFNANIPGVFEVESEKSHKLFFTLEVR